MLRCGNFSQYEKMVFTLRNLKHKVLFYKGKIYLLYKT